MRGPSHILCHAIIAFCAILLGPTRAQGQDAAPVVAGGKEYFRVVLHRVQVDSPIVLPHQFIVAGSDSVVLDSLHTLRAGIHYTIDHRHGILLLDSSMVAAVAPDTPSVIDVWYRHLPFSFRDAYFRRKLVHVPDTVGGDTLRVARPPARINLEDIFGPDLQKSGSIVRGFTVGSNRDLSLNSGLRMQLAGKITSDIDVTAVLTDENTPIQPEGTTQTLQEFDKVFVEIRGPDIAATLGDFNLDFTGTEFARLSRKLQGAKGTAEHRIGGVQSSATVSGAAPRGKYVSNQLRGIEGVQGPYQLTGRNGERSIIVIAGTERVYVDGEQQTRGETNDYTIDYSAAAVSFTPRRLITSASRIVVDFEYTDRQYGRTLFATQASSRLIGGEGALVFSYFREADDQDDPVDFVLSDSARHILAAAGNNRLKAAVDGVTRVDSNGLYRLHTVDTTLAGVDTTIRYYVYAPGDSAAVYNITFSDVGEGQGEYARRQLGVFEWRGPGGGRYLPVRLLPLPQKQELLDLRLDMAPTSELKVSAEFARSAFDANRFSTVDDDEKAGHALSFRASYAPMSVKVGGKDIGSMHLELKHRFVEHRFAPLDRTNEIEFNRKWGIDNLPQASEVIQEASLKYLPVEALALSGGYGRISRGTDMRSTRADAAALLRGTALPSIEYHLEHVRSEESPGDRSGAWFRQRGKAEHQFGAIVPRFRMEHEDRSIASLSSGILQPGSFHFNLFAPGVTVRDVWNLTFSSEFEYRTDNSFHLGSVARESRTVTQSYEVSLKDVKDLASSLTVTLREKRFTEAFQLPGNQDVKTVLVRNNSRYTPLNRGVEADVLYEVVTERSSRLERVFVPVARGTGNYIHRDLNNNGIREENEFEQVRFDGDFIVVTIPSDDLIPVIDLKTSARFRVTPARFIRRHDNIWNQVVSAISSESYVRVEEKSTEPDLKRIYLLDFSAFRRDPTTIAGLLLLTQDVHVLEARPEFSLRFRYSQRKALSTFSATTESFYVRERSVRLRWQLVQEISNQIDYVNKRDRVSSLQLSSRLRDIFSHTMSFDLSYRPQQSVELGFRVDVGRSTDRFPTQPIEADLNAQTLRLVYSLAGAGQARGEVSREEILLTRHVESYAYELTGGRVPGKSWLWRAGLDYRITDFIQSTVSYDGRTEGGRPAVHTARAEVRAFF